jgi:O-antigen ligase
VLKGKNPRLRLFSVFVLVITGLAIYVSGQRSSWIAVLLSLFLISINSGIRGWLISLVAAIGLEFVPEEFWIRIATITTAVLGGQITDTSTLSRLDRWQYAIDAIATNPLTGVGFDGRLIHNAPLEIGARIGLIPAICFMVFLVLVIVRIWKAGQNSESRTARRYSLVFLALSIPWIMQLMVETVLQVPPFAAAQWLMLAVAWYLPNIMESATPPEPDERDSLAEVPQPTPLLEYETRDSR